MVSVAGISFLPRLKGALIVYTDPSGIDKAHLVVGESVEESIGFVITGPH